MCYSKCFSSIPIPARWEGPTVLSPTKELTEVDLNHRDYRLAIVCPQGLNLETHAKIVQSLFTYVYRGMIEILPFFFGSGLLAGPVLVAAGATTVSFSVLSAPKAILSTFSKNPSRSSHVICTPGWSHLPDTHTLFGCELRSTRNSSFPIHTQYCKPKLVLLGMEDCTTVRVRLGRTEPNHFFHYATGESNCETLKTSAYGTDTGGRTLFSCRNRSCTEDSLLRKTLPLPAGGRILSHR